MTPACCYLGNYRARVQCRGGAAPGAGGEPVLSGQSAPGVAVAARRLGGQSQADRAVVAGGAPAGGRARGPSAGPAPGYRLPFRVWALVDDCTKGCPLQVVDRSRPPGGWSRRSTPRSESFDRKLRDECLSVHKTSTPWRPNGPRSPRGARNTTPGGTTKAWLGGRRPRSRGGSPLGVSSVAE